MTMISDERGFFLVIGLESDQVLVRKSDGKRYVDHDPLPLSSVRMKALRVRHFYKSGEVYYSGAWSFMLKGMSGWAVQRFQTKWLIDEMIQRRYNAEPLVFHQRLNVLQAVVTLNMKGVSPVTSIDLIEHLQGSDRWVEHPDCAQLERNTELILESWAIEGVLNSAHGSYYATGQAISVLDRVAREDSRFEAVDRANTKIIILTLCLVFTGLVQALVTWLARTS